MRAPDHVGRHFKVAGPLNVPRAPQGRPVVFTAGQSDPGKEPAARHTDPMFGAGDSKATCQAEYADIKGRMGLATPANPHFDRSRPTISRTAVD